MPSIHTLSLRPRLERRSSEIPIATAVLGDTAIAAIASAWGGWCDPDAELPAVTASLAVLATAARTTTPDWPAALAAAFAAVPAAIDPLMIGWPPDDDLYPVTCLTCAVVTPAGIFLAAVGSLIACVLTDGRVTRSSEPHTLHRKLRDEGTIPADQLAQIPAAFREVIVGALGPSTHNSSPPELSTWPPLAAGQSLLLTDRRIVALLRRTLPLPGDLQGAAWLHAAMSIAIDDHGAPGPPELADRIGVLIEP